MDVQTIQSALADALSELGVRVYDYMSAQPEPPCIIVYPADTTYHPTFTNEDISFLLRVLVPAQLAQSGSVILNGLLSTEGDTSIPRAIEHDPTLGGTVSSTEVAGWTGYTTTQDPEHGTQFFTAQVAVEIYV
jgi:hypothetical protein